MSEDTPPPGSGRRLAYTMTEISRWRFTEAQLMAELAKVEAAQKARQGKAARPGENCMPAKTLPPGLADERADADQPREGPVP